MKKTKSIIGILTSLFIFYLIVSSIWSFLNIQICSSASPKNYTCEEVAENNVKNCKYVILSWKKVDYSKELKKCEEWEQRQEK